ncbi:porin family protein [Lysobacter sp. MMG2]|uniref:outer membrane beta-barrel protein n=1 Tax=Lysobacter sp. MMG2 TaxID=2801338 RepID=UPI001C225D62|nr:outer membrane beta-barrel protein [Lysobacter sp. MMG2]MBU8977233.1 porin family protein [Lysobacter sp. MMG2]
MKKELALALALAVAPTAALADGHSYTYLEAGYAQLEQELPGLDGFEVEDIKAGGFFIGGSAAVSPSLHVFGAYRKGDDDDLVVSAPVVGPIGSASIDMSQAVLGMGYHHGLSERTDLVAELSWLNTEIDVKGDDEGAQKGDDVRAAVGVRHNIANNVEVWIKGNYTDGDVYDGAFSASAGLQYKLTSTWGLVAEAEGGGDSAMFAVGARASF